MIKRSDETWLASLREIRRQAKHLADVRGLGNQVEGRSRFLDKSDDNLRQVLKTKVTSSFDLLPLNAEKQLDI